MLVLPAIVGCRAWDRFAFEGDDAGPVDARAVDAPSSGRFCADYPDVALCEDFEGEPVGVLLELGGTCAVTDLGGNRALVCDAGPGEAAAVQLPIDDGPSIHARFRLHTLERAATGYFEGAYLFDLQTDSALVVAVGHQPSQVLLSAFDTFDGAGTDFAADATCVELHIEEQVGGARQVQVVVADGAGGRSTLMLTSPSALTIAPMLILKLGVPFNMDAGRVRMAVDDVVVSTTPLACP